MLNIKNDILPRLIYLFPNISAWVDWSARLQLGGECVAKSSATSVFVFGVVAAIHVAEVGGLRGYVIKNIYMLFNDSWFWLHSNNTDKFVIMIVTVNIFESYVLLKDYYSYNFSLNTLKDFLSYT